MAELLRCKPADGDKQAANIGRDDESLVVLNQLSAPIYLAYGRPPSTTDWDFVIPGSSYINIPIVGGNSRVEFLVKYPGAVPATDVQAIVWRHSCPFQPFVGAIA